MTQAAAEEMIRTSAQLGWQLGIHAIGDAAIEQVAQLYADALRQHPRPDHRWFLSHFTMLPSDETLDLMAGNAIYAAAQPNFLYNLEGRYVDTLDGARLEHVNPVATPLRHGVFVAFGSDNLPIGPMVGLYAAITRKGSSGRVFGIEEAVSREQAIRMYTRDGAYFTWEERQKGTLEPGKFADMIVLDRDPLTVPAEQLLATRVDLTIVGGRIVYRRAEPNR
jgi:predicted amidohydrolase YtcJ